MIYPKFLKENDLLGITALSGGCKNNLNELQISINNLSKTYQVMVTNDTYGETMVSADIKTRVQEFNDIIKKDIKMLYIARGGNFLVDTLPYLDYETLKKKRIWVQGHSDPTSLLYILTTKYDLATIYGINGKGYDSEILENYQKNNLEIIKGNLNFQESYQDRPEKSLNGNFTSAGMIIGGCMECLKDIIGTNFDNTKEFIEKYRNYGIIWYFDIFNMASEDVYNTLLQFKNSGWFDYSNTFLFGSVIYPDSYYNLSYEDMIKKGLGDKCNIVIDTNIGHVRPSFTMINGSIGHVTYENNKLVIQQEVNNENNG